MSSLWPDVVVLLLFALPAAAAAQGKSGLHGIRIEAGMSDNHAGHDVFPAGAVRLFTIADRGGLVTIEGGGLIAGPSLGGDAGVTVRRPITPRVFVILRGGAGLLLEDGYTGMFWRFGGGVGVALATGHALTFTYQRGGHDRGAAGPHLLMMGLERRFGRR